MRVLKLIGRCQYNPLYDISKKTYRFKIRYLYYMYFAFVFTKPIRPQFSRWAANPRYKPDPQFLNLVIIRVSFTILFIGPLALAFLTRSTELVLCTRICNVEVDFL